MADTEVLSLHVLAERLAEVEGYLHLAEKRQQISELEAESARPNFWNDAETAQKVMTQLSSLRDDVAGIDKAKEKLGDAEAAFELGTELEDQASLDESQALAASLEKDLSELELSSWFTDELDHGDAIVTIKPGQGGLESQDWCEMLFRMYLKYCDRRGWKVDINDAPAAEVIEFPLRMIKSADRHHLRE